MKLRAEIKENAKKGFTAQYWLAVGTFVLVAVIGSALATPGVFTLSHTRAFGSLGLASLLLMPPIYVGYAFFSLRIYRGQEADIGSVFSRGFNDYGRTLGGMLWMYLFTFLWSLLFIVPGIIKAFAYFMTPYILADSKNVSATDALKLSMRMTYGYKGEIFVMFLSFIGWGLLSAITFGIVGIFYAGPYMSTSLAGLYNELKENALAKGFVKAEELA